MATAQQLQNALLTEHFRYTPLTLLDDIINTVNELVFRAINAIDEGLHGIPPEALGFHLPPAQAASLSTEESRHAALVEQKETEIGNGIVQLESLLNATVDRDFDKFEIYTLRNILALGHADEEVKGLSRWVKLDHYKHLDLDAVKGLPRPEEVQLRRRKLNETLKLNAMLKAEEAKNATVLEQLEALMESPFGFLDARTQQTPGQPLTQDVQYAMSQLPALRQLVAQLREALTALPNARRGAEDPESAEAKRRQYIERQARRAMERRGVSAEEGSQRSTAVPGKKVGREEVEGMEAVVQALGGAPILRQHERKDDDDD